MTLLDPAPAIRYRVGTLSYTMGGLISVFFWMLWGDLCVNIMETIIPRLVPVRLGHLGASPATVGLVAASIPAGVELLVNPFVSTYSDRYRSRWGRRRPFILLCTPILALCLIAVGFADDLGPKLHSALGGLGMSEQTMTIALLGLLLAIFQIFNVAVLATYYYLIADVVPQAVIGKFTAMYRVVGTLGGVIFNQFIFKYADDYEWQIYTGCAAVYVVAFLLMGWRVKEGQYPPPPKLTENRSGPEAVAQWLRESFSIRFYQKLFTIGLFYYFAIGSVIFQQNFALYDLGMSKADAGATFAWAGLISLPLFFVLGPLADKFHPVRMLIGGMAVMGVAALGCHLFIKDAASFKLWTIIWTFAQTAYLGGQISLLPRTLPREQYGQYCAANNTLCAIGKFGAPALCGLLIGALGSNRYGYLWTACFSACGVVACIIVYLHWKRLGGDLGYKPPLYAGMSSSFDEPHPGTPTEVAPIAEPAEMASGAVPVVEAGRPDALQQASDGAPPTPPQSR
jgi:MFS family permease